MVIKIENGAPRSSVHIVWGGIAIFLTASAAALDRMPLHLPPCIFRELTGFPCLTCGGTRSLAALGQFHVAASFMFNPLVLLVALVTITFSVMISLGFLLRKKLSLAFSDTEKGILRIVVLVLVALNWAFLILREKP